MKLPGLLAVIFGLLLPTSARAQSITLENLPEHGPVEKAGNDALRGYDILFIQDDSTFITSGWRPPFQPYQYVNYLRGDTISLSESDSPAVCRGERIGYCGEPGYKITLKDQQLTLTSLGNTGAYYSGTYTRVDAQPPER